MDLARRTVDAVRFARDGVRVHYAPDAKLAESALLIARAIVQLEDRGGDRELRASAFAMLDQAGQTIAEELRLRAGLRQSTKSLARW